MLLNTIKYILLFTFLFVSVIVYVGACGKEIFEDAEQPEMAESLDEELPKLKTETTL